MNNALLGLLLSVSGSTVAPDAAVTPVVTVACDVELNVIEPHPKALNVRAAPDAKSAKVITVLKPIGDWTQVHVIGQRGEWLQIDHAEAIDASAENGLRQVFQGDGWLPVDKLGISKLYVGDGTIIRDEPTAEGHVLLRIDSPDNEPTATKVIGCEAKYIQVEFGKQAGWTNSWCTNEQAACG